MSIGGHPQSRGHPGQGSQPTADPEWQEKLLEFHLELSQERCVPSASLSNQPKFKWKSAEDALCANFMGFSVMMAFAAVLADVNETGRQSFQSIRLLQSHILQLRDSGNHDVADELEFYLDMACLVKKRPPPKTAGGDCSSEVTRGTADGNGSQASRNFSSFFSSKPALTEKSDRLDLAWMRNCYDEDDRRLSGDNIAIPPPPLSDVLKFSSPGVCSSTAPSSRKYIKERRRQIKDIGKRCGWSAYDVYNAHLVLDFLEFRLPPPPKRTVLDRLLGRKRVLNYSTSTRPNSQVPASCSRMDRFS